MDEFGIFIFGSIFALFLIFYAIGKWYPGSGAEQIDWKPTRSPELEAQLEIEDMEQMLEAANERRRRKGKPEVTEESVQEQVQEDDRWRRELVDRYRKDGGGEDAEAEDMSQLLELANAARRRKGEPEITEAELRAEVEGDSASDA